MGHRIQFEFSDEQFSRFERIAQYTGRSSKAEIVREALRLYELIAATADGGGSVALFAEDNMGGIPTVFGAEWLA